MSDPSSSSPYPSRPPLLWSSTSSLSSEIISSDDSSLEWLKFIGVRVDSIPLSPSFSPSSSSSTSSPSSSVSTDNDKDIDSHINVHPDSPSTNASKTTLSSPLLSLLITKYFPFGSLSYRPVAEELDPQSPLSSLSKNHYKYIPTQDFRNNSFSSSISSLSSSTSTSSSHSSPLLYLQSSSWASRLKSSPLDYTGLQLWPISLYTSNFLLYAIEHSSLFTNVMGKMGCHHHNIIEIGCGGGMLAMAMRKGIEEYCKKNNNNKNIQSINNINIMSKINIYATDNNEFALILSKYNEIFNRNTTYTTSQDSDNVNDTIIDTSPTTITIPIHVSSLSWGPSTTPSFSHHNGPFPLIIGSDLFYSSPSIPLLLSTIHHLLPPYVPHYYSMFSYCYPALEEEVGGEKGGLPCFLMGYEERFPKLTEEFIRKINGNSCSDDDDQKVKNGHLEKDQGKDEKRESDENNNNNENNENNNNHHPNDSEEEFHFSLYVIRQGPSESISSLLSHPFHSSITNRRQLDYFNVSHINSLPVLWIPTYEDFLLLHSLRHKNHSTNANDVNATPPYYIFLIIRRPIRMKAMFFEVEKKLYPIVDGMMAFSEASKRSVAERVLYREWRKDKSSNDSKIDDEWNYSLSPFNSLPSTNDVLSIYNIIQSDESHLSHTTLIPSPYHFSSSVTFVEGEMKYLYDGELNGNRNGKKRKNDKKSAMDHQWGRPVRTFAIREGKTGEMIGSVGVKYDLYPNTPNKNTNCTNNTTDDHYHNTTSSCGDNGHPDTEIEIGYYISPRYRRLGILSSALRCLLSLIFKHRYYSLSITMVTAYIFQDNIASFKLLESLGFVRKGEGEKMKENVKGKEGMVKYFRYEMRLADWVEKNVVEMREVIPKGFPLPFELYTINSKIPTNSNTATTTAITSTTNPSSSAPSPDSNALSPSSVSSSLPPPSPHQHTYQCLLRPLLPWDYPSLFPIASYTYDGHDFLTLDYPYWSDARPEKWENFTEKIHINVHDNNHNDNIDDHNNNQNVPPPSHRSSRRSTRLGRLPFPQTIRVFGIELLSSTDTPLHRDFVHSIVSCEALRTMYGEDGKLSWGWIFGLRVQQRCRSLGLSSLIHKKMVMMMEYMANIGKASMPNVTPYVSPFSPITQSSLSLPSSFPPIHSIGEAATSVNHASLHLATKSGLSANWQCEWIRYSPLNDGNMKQMRDILHKFLMAKQEETGIPLPYSLTSHSSSFSPQVASINDVLSIVNYNRSLPSPSFPSMFSFLTFEWFVFPLTLENLTLLLSLPFDSYHNIPYDGDVNMQPILYMDQKTHSFIILRHGLDFTTRMLSFSIFSDDDMMVAYWTIFCIDKALEYNEKQREKRNQKQGEEKKKEIPIGHFDDDDIHYKHHDVNKYYPLITTLDAYWGECFFPKFKVFMDKYKKSKESASNKEKPSTSSSLSPSPSPLLDTIDIGTFPPPAHLTHVFPSLSTCDRHYGIPYHVDGEKNYLVPGDKVVLLKKKVEERRE